MIFWEDPHNDNQAVGHNVTAFSEGGNLKLRGGNFPPLKVLKKTLAVCGREGQVEASIVGNSTNLTLNW